MRYPLLQKYSAYLFENHLEDFVRFQINRAHEENIPFLKHLGHMTENELFKYSLAGNKRYLKGIIQGIIMDEAVQTSQMWKRGELPSVGKFDVLISDIILSNTLRKEALFLFLKEYTTDILEYENILLEIQRLHSELIQISFQAYIDVQQEAVLKEKQLTEKVLDSSRSSIVALETIRNGGGNIKDFKYVILNSKAEEMLGPKEEFIGSTVLTKFPTIVQEGIYEKYLNTVESGESFHIIFNYPYEGFNHWFRQIGVKWTDGLVVTTDDITKLKESEEKIRELNRTLEEKIDERTQELQVKNKELNKINEDLDNFIYTASHDLKAPVSNLEGLITALSEIIGSDGSSISEKKELIHLMETSINRFKNTIQDLTDITKTQKQFHVELENIDIEEILDDVLHDNKEIIEEASARINIDIGNCRYIKFSRVNLKSIFFNLINNSIKYRSSERKPEVSIACKKDDNYIYITISDNGLGIPGQNLNKIFSMFKRFHTHVDGSGIGLYLVKRMIENAEGRIEVESIVDQGTTFRIYLNNV